MKKLVLVLSVLMVSSCGYTDRLLASATGYTIMCVDGVEYIQFTSGATAKINADGTISTCE